MFILDRIFALCKEQGKSQVDLANFLGISKNNVTDWKGGRSRSYEKYLYQIAAYLGTTPEYLRGETAEKEKAAASGDLSASEARLLSLFRALNADGQARAVETLEDMVAGGRYKKEAVPRVG